MNTTSRVCAQVYFYVTGDLQDRVVPHSISHTMSPKQTKTLATAVLWPVFDFCNCASVELVQREYLVSPVIQHCLTLCQSDCGSYASIT